MPYGVTSAGFGNGEFGRTSCGNGPWMPFPFQLSYPSGEEIAFNTQVFQFENLTEQRYVYGTERSLTLRGLVQADSSIAIEVQTFVRAMQGGLTPFTLVNPRNGMPYIVRFDGDQFGRSTRAGVIQDPLDLTMRTSRRQSWAEAVWASSPTAWYRCADTLTSSVLTDTTTQGAHGVCTGVMSWGKPGAVYGDFSAAFEARSHNTLNTAVKMPGWEIGGGVGSTLPRRTMTLAMFLQQSFTIPTTQTVLQFFRKDAVPVATDLLFMYDGFFHVNCQHVPYWLGDGAWHQIVLASGAGTGIQAYVDGTYVMSMADWYDFQVTSAVLASQGTGFAGTFLGMIDEFIVWNNIKLDPTTIGFLYALSQDET